MRCVEGMAFAHTRARSVPPHPGRPRHPRHPRHPTINVLLAGATGFIGSRLHCAAARDRHHEVLCAAGARPADVLHMGLQSVDFAQTHRWPTGGRCSPVDVVVNAVGILRERGPATFDALHVRAPAALFEACAEEGVKRVVQVSALGADAAAATAYHLSKREADERLLALPANGIVVQPSLIYGPGGTSAALFTMLASLPVIPLPGGGDQRTQPIHIDDAVEAMVRSSRWQGPAARRVALVGPRADHAARLPAVAPPGVAAADWPRSAGAHGPGARRRGRRRVAAANAARSRQPLDARARQRGAGGRHAGAARPPAARAARPSSNRAMQQACG